MPNFCAFFIFLTLVYLLRYGQKEFLGQSISKMRNCSWIDAVYSLLKAPCNSFIWQIESGCPPG